MFLQDERGRNGCIFCLIILRVFFWSVGREGFSAKVLEKRLPFVVRVRMPLARTQHGLGQQGAVCWVSSALASGGLLQLSDGLPVSLGARNTTATDYLAL